MKKIVVIGSSCSGKTTFAKRLARVLSAKHVELDSIFWKPAWQECEAEEFKAKVLSAIGEPSWVVDGDYQGRLFETVWSQADAIVWLNPPFRELIFRFFRRSIGRSLKNELLWNGCQESLKNSIFSKNSLFVYILKTHKRRTAKYEMLMASPPFPHLHLVRIRTNAEIESFLRTLSTK